MKRKTICLVHLILCIMLLALTLPGIATPATERPTALVIGNSSYNTSSLRNPVNDANDMASALKRLGFEVILRKNATQQAGGYGRCYS
jgi:hypothetical protein